MLLEAKPGWTMLICGVVATTRLEDAGYVHIEKSFAGKRPRTTYALTPARREAFERYRTAVDGLLRNGR